MQHFQSILIVVGLLAISGVLIHGYLLSRKDKSEEKETLENVDLFAEKNAYELENSPNDGIISEVRIISNEAESEEREIDFSLAVNDDHLDPVVFSTSDPEPGFEIGNVEKEDESFHGESMPTESFSEQPKENIIDSEPQTDVDKEEFVQPQDLFIFNVVAKDDMKLGGHELLQFFLTSGFRFGEMSIFHRHENSDGTGPILFSIANMMAPGIFEPENMEQFKSEGVSFFLTAPNENIDVKSSFSLMLRAVEQMAEEFDCIVLNAARDPMTQEQFIEYNNRLLLHI
jgi:cell division protein ZipA